MAGADGTETHETAEVHHREMAVGIVAIAPNIPHEKRPDDLAVLAQEFLVVKDGTVVESGCDDGAVQGGCPALVTLNGIHEGVNDIRAFVQETAGLGGVAQQVVVVGIHTGDHGFAELLGVEEIHERLSLAFPQVVMRRQLHLEVARSVLVVIEDGAPEGHILEALHISHNTPPRPRGSQAVGRFKIGRAEVMGKPLHSSFINHHSSIKQ